MSNRRVIYCRQRELCSVTMEYCTVSTTFKNDAVLTLSFFLNAIAIDMIYMLKRMDEATSWSGSK